MKDRALISDIQKFSLNDGPGIRTIVFFKGCSMKCPWCSNPETQDAGRNIMINAKLCIGCDSCKRVCKRGAVIVEEDGYRWIDRSKCDACTECADVCPPKGIRAVGDWQTMDEVLREIEKDRLFYEQSGGGVTLSGGEVLMQHEFATALLESCKRRGLPTAVETTGFAPWAHVEELAENTDLFLYDLKIMDPARHEEVIGVRNEPILHNLERLALKKKGKIILRVPLVPSYTADEENVRAIGKTAAAYHISRVDLLPYHRYGEGKYAKLGRDYTLKEIGHLSDEEVQQARGILEDMGLEVDIGG
jgi:pyruvate formate lyase activating enzyme